MEEIEISEIQEKLGTQFLPFLQSGLDLLTSEERLEIFSNYCRGCGTIGPCYCQNDE